MSCLTHFALNKQLPQVTQSRLRHIRHGIRLYVDSCDSNHTYRGGRSSNDIPCRRGSCVFGTSHFRMFRTEAEGALRVPAFARQGKLVKEYQNLLEAADTKVRRSVEDIKNTKSATVITVPLGLEKRLDKRMEREQTKQAQRQRIIDASREGRKTRIIIRCKQQSKNHYFGQSYEKNKVIPLASAGWHHRKSAGDYFTLFPGYKKDDPFLMEGAEAATFQDLGVSQVLSDRLKMAGIQTPTHIQVFGIPQILKGGRNVITAETGCGKTLVYLLPIIQQLLEDKRFKVRPKVGQPTAVVLVPSRELADQIYRVAVQLTQNLDISVKLIQGGSLGQKMKNPSTKSVDLLIATTNALTVLSAAGVFGTDRILHLVLDEADTLLDDSFFPELVGPYLKRLDWDDLQKQIQLTLVSATMPQGINSTIGQIMKTDDFEYCSTPGLHHTLPHVPQKFIRMRKSHKPIKIKEIVETDLEKKIPLMIFCNKNETCDWLSHYLNENGLTSVAVHGRMPLKYRRGRLDFYQRGEVNVLVCTDLASRGIDTVRTQHVINYEFPLYLADYIHRCGRTGRVGSQHGCHVTNFISRPGEVQAVNKIELSVRKEKELPNVDANIKKLYSKHYGEFVEIEPIRKDKNEETIADEPLSQSDSSDSSDDEAEEDTDHSDHIRRRRRR